MRPARVDTSTAAALCSRMRAPRSSGVLRAAPPPCNTHSSPPQPPCPPHPHPHPTRPAPPHPTPHPAQERHLLLHGLVCDGSGDQGAGRAQGRAGRAALPVPPLRRQAGRGGAGFLELPLRAHARAQGARCEGRAQAEAIASVRLPGPLCCCCRGEARALRSALPLVSLAPAHHLQPCVPLQECHCMLFLTEDNDFR